MRKFLVLAALLFAFASIAIPLTGTTEAAICTEGGCPPPPKKPAPQTQSNSHTGAWAVGCGIASAGSFMIGSAIHAGDRNDPRQLTLTEAYWHASACPFLLPLALVAQAMCPDNKGTYEVARLAFHYLRKHPSSDQSAFTAAYGEACRTGELSRKTWASLISLI